MALLTNLVSYWKLDEASGNAADSVGSNTLTNNNTITYAAAKINNGASLNGSNQYFNSAAAGLQITGDLTYAMWVKPTVQLNRLSLLNTYATAGNGLGVITTLEDISGVLKMRFANYISGSNKDYTSTATVASGSWSHIAFVYHASAGQVEFYVNGTSLDSPTGFPTSITSVSSMIFGNDGNLGTGNWYLGMVDEVGIWSRALTSTEIASLYNGGAGLAYPFTAAATGNFFAFF